MIHSTILFNMKDEKMDALQLYPVPSTYKGPINDLLIFAYATQTDAGKYIDYRITSNLVRPLISADSLFSKKWFFSLYLLVRLSFREFSILL